MWKKPWTYREGFVIVLGLLLAGMMLQWSVGPMEWVIFLWPANLIALISFFLLMLAGFLLRRRAYFLRFISTGRAAVPTLIVGSILVVVMGLSPQVPEGKAPVDPIGITRMLSFWPFILVICWMMVIVGLTALRQIFHWQWRQLPSLVCHIGLLLCMTAGTLGSADMQRLKMYCMVDTPEWRAIDHNGKVHELPIAIELKNFSMTENASHHLKYASDVQVYTKQGQNILGHLEVNKPLNVNGWTIYQYGYDRSMGTKSQLSILEFVADPWLPVVYVGIYMILTGAVLLFITAQRRKEDTL